MLPMSPSTVSSTMTGLSRSDTSPSLVQSQVSSLWVLYLTFCCLLEEKEILLSRFLTLRDIPTGQICTIT